MLLAFALVVTVGLSSCGSSPGAARTPVDNSRVSYDDTGKRVDAHDGQLVYERSTGLVYLIGTAYGCGFRLNSARSTPYCGVRIYSSRDLARWTPVGAVGGYAFDPNTPAVQSRCDSDHFGCFRPRMAQRPDGRWVLWLNDAGGYIAMTASSPRGPFVESAVPVTVSVNMRGSPLAYGDEDLYADGGSGYVAYTVIGPNNSHDLVVERLNATWTAGIGQYSRYRVGHVIEAPSLFERAGLWYLTYSDPACPYCANAGTGYATANNPLGPWERRGKILPTSCGGQPSKVNVLGGTYVLQVDRWHQVRRRSEPPTFDTNQYLANTYLAPLSFARDGSLPAQRCIARWYFDPLPAEPVVR